MLLVYVDKYILKNQKSFLFFKCNIVYYLNQPQPPKEGIKNVDTRLQRSIFILYEKQFH